MTEATDAETAWLQLDGDEPGIACMFDGPVAKEGDVVEIVCTKAGIPMNFKLRVVRKADTSGEV